MPDSSHSKPGSDRTEDSQTGPPIAKPAPTAGATATDPTWLMRLWLALPDWSLRLVGAGFFFAFLGWEISDYFTSGFWKSWNYYHLGKGHYIYVPWAKILIDITYLLIALSFIFRIPPRSRASRPRDIIVPLVAAFWPFWPFAIKVILVWSHSDSAGAYVAFMFNRHLSLSAFVAGSACVVAGNILDVWGYAVLFRSFSLVAEARELKVRGPYRLIRHPIYFGQILSQGGVWLLFATPHPIWAAFYFSFVGLQLYRSWIEDQVLERSFGDSYLAWKRKTIWFF